MKLFFTVSCVHTVMHTCSLVWPWVARLPALIVITPMHSGFVCMGFSHCKLFQSIYGLGLLSEFTMP